MERGRVRVLVIVNPEDRGIPVHDLNNPPSPICRPNHPLRAKHHCLTCSYAYPSANR